MKDEEMAEEYVKQKYPTLEIKAVFNRYVEMYLAGLEAGRPQWHDLRKDPNDLPKGQINRFLFAYVKNYGGKRPMLVCYNGEWFYDANTYNNEVKVIEWCEIPQFKE